MTNVAKRLIDYAKYETTSDEYSETCPSTPGQLILGKHLVEELKSVGVKDAYMDKDGYVYGSIEANAKGKAIGFIAHMDTSDAVSGKNVNPRIIENYDGEDIKLSDEVTTSITKFPNLKNYKGKTLIVTDGTTLLGADDKAGVAEIIEMLDILNKNPDIKHGLIRIGFTPDEEIGRGADRFNLNDFKVDFAYTLDGGKPNEIEFENFNAAKATVNIKGISVHPGSAKNIMINALNVAHEFHNMLPKEARPEYTEGYEGFNALMDMSGSVESATLDYIIRNHDSNLLEKQKSDFINAEKVLNEKYGLNTVKVDIKDQYRNMKECFSNNKTPIELVKKAVEAIGLNYEAVAIRGGTDGATLSWNGLLCPNIGTGGQNFHGIHELACVEEMEDMVKLVLKIIELSLD